MHLGFVTQDEFEEACNVLNKFSNGVISSGSVEDMVKMLDINKDGMIDFNEFLEAFRLVSLSVASGHEDMAPSETSTVGEDNIRDTESVTTTLKDNEYSSSVAEVQVN